MVLLLLKKFITCSILHPKQQFHTPIAFFFAENTPIAYNYVGIWYMRLKKHRLLGDVSQRTWNSLRVFYIIVAPKCVLHL